VNGGRAPGGIGKVACLLAGIVLAAAPLRPAAAFAGEGGDGPSAKQHFLQGVSHFKEGKFSLALESFKASYALHPHWELHYDIGLCYKELGFYVEAKREFEAYIIQGKGKIPIDRQEIIFSVMAEITGLLGLLDVTVNVKGAAITVDGHLVGTCPLPGPIELNRGEHVIEASAGGYVPSGGTFVVEEGERKAMTIDLEPADKGAGAGAAQEAPVVVEGSGGKRLAPPWVLYTGMALSVALLGAGAVTGALTLEKRGDVDHLVGSYDPATATWEEYLRVSSRLDDMKEKGRLLGTTTTVLLCAGAAVGLTTLALFIADRKLEKGERRAAALLGFDPAARSGVAAVRVFF
jgi:tetratricopeptide (TPR) repeat protein